MKEEHAVICACGFGAEFVCECVRSERIKLRRAVLAGEFWAQHGKLQMGTAGLITSKLVSQTPPFFPLGLKFRARGHFCGKKMQWASTAAAAY